MAAGGFERNPVLRRQFFGDNGDERFANEPRPYNDLGRVLYEETSLHWIQAPDDGLLYIANRVSDSPAKFVARMDSG